MMKNITVRNFVTYGKDLEINKQIDRNLLHANTTLGSLDGDGVYALVDLSADTTNGNEIISGIVTCADEQFKELVQFSIGAFIKITV